jgi:hypothetical protein
MRSRLTVLVLGLAVACGLLSSCRKTEWTKQEVVEWYSQYEAAVRGGLLYRGSDETWHYFIARVMDDWAFIQIKKDELKLEDERVYSQASSAPFSYYAVDPSHDFQKIAVKKEANQTLQTTRYGAARLRSCLI